MSDYHTIAKQQAAHGQIVSQPFGGPPNAEDVLRALREISDPLAKACGVCGAAIGVPCVGCRAGSVHGARVFRLATAVLR